MNDNNTYQAPAIAEIGSVIDATAGLASSGKRFDGTYKKGQPAINVKFFPY